MSPKDSEDDVRPRLRPAKRQEPRFISQVLLKAGKAGTPAAHRKGKRPGARLGRGHVAAKFVEAHIRPKSRSVLIKTRIVNLRHTSPRAIRKHLRYIEREGVGPLNEPGQAYGPTCDKVDLQSFEKRGLGDRHQFRFIVATEDSHEIGDLRSFTRQLMTRMEADLGSRLEWVAVDHWNTGQPHTHIVLRGKDDIGNDLIISSDYIVNGLRGRACELATQWLGPRTDLALQRTRQQEIRQERWTILDQCLLQSANSDGQIQLSQFAQHPRRQMLVARLKHLERMGLAHEQRSGQWSIHRTAESTLRAIEERESMHYVLQRQLGGQYQQVQVAEPHPGAPSLAGKIIAKAMGNEFHENNFLLLDGVDGKVHYLALPADAELSRFPLDAVVQVSSIFEQGQQLNNQSQGAWRIRMHGSLSLEQQIRAPGATWLDRQLINGGKDIGSVGFGAQTRTALRQRTAFLMELGLVSQRAGQLLLGGDLLTRLRDRELKQAASEITAQSGLRYQPIGNDGNAQGIYRRDLQLVSGRFAVLEDGKSFSLLPWRPMIEHRLGQQLEAQITQGRVSWRLGRQRTRTLG